MTQEDMLKALDLDATPAGESEPSVQIDTQAPAGPAIPQEPNALVLDRWTKRQGRQIREKLLNENPESGFVARPIHDLDSIDLADLHQSVFDPTPELVEQGACQDVVKYKYFQELMDTPGFHELRSSTVLDDAATDLAIERLSEGLVSLRQQDQKKRENGEEGTGPDDGDFGIGRVATKAVGQANRDVQDLQDARDGLGLGAGSGQVGQLEVSQAIELYKQMRRDPNLQKIINLAGKYRLFGQSQQRRKVIHGYDDFVGVTIGGDLARLTQSELVNLGTPELEDEVCRRLLDSQAMVQEFHGQEPVAKGPMILAIDESGSMTCPCQDGNTRIQHAKALALSFGYLARQQRRWCALVAWSSSNERRTIVLPPDRWDHGALISWIGGFFCGGTEPPVSDMPAIYAQTGALVGKTDIVYITDGTVCIDPTSIAGFLEWKQEVQAKVITLIVSSQAGDMTKISDETHVIKSLGLNDATARVLSI